MFSLMGYYIFIFIFRLFAIARHYQIPPEQSRYPADDQFLPVNLVKIIITEKKFINMQKCHSLKT